jgi:chromosome segregation protein
LRLTHLKLAGFKSFVDATTLHLHGQRVGVVGPNGCGKSNVMESIRWVLGESSAKEMRGDSMQDVIFNGSSNRKAISRASVELIFDNSLGGASGEWSQYAEISVKRVIERDKGSSYYINNTPVRRRDVADLFLGTGLGGRAYAIIGQNTISRIVEAKPEELRVFLEEAAGISKYKERRRETELRLRDTRENLLRVEDIRQEIDKQIVRLEAQAVVTQQYHQLQIALKRAHGQLWLLKKRDAGASWEKTRRQVEKLVNDLEAQMANLRKTESQLETLRQQNFAANEAVQQAQAQYYETNAEVSSLEQQVKHTQEARERLNLQLQQIATQSEKLEAHRKNLDASLAEELQKQAQADADEQQSSESLAQLKAGLPALEAAFSASQRQLTEVQKALTETEQAVRLENTQLGYADRNIEELQHRLQRLQTDMQSLQLPDIAGLEDARRTLSAMQQQLAKTEQAIADARTREQEQTEVIRVLRQQQQDGQAQVAQVEAQIHSLQKIQQSIGHETKIDDWLKQHGLQNAERLWQKITIASGWETALEAVLGARLNAILGSGNLHGDLSRPHATVVLAETGGGGKAGEVASGFQPLSSVIEQMAPEVSGVLQDWLQGIYMLEDAGQAAKLRQQLAPGELLVSRKGDIYSRRSLTLYSPQSALHGVLERQRELETLQASLPQAQETVTGLSAQLRQADEGMQQLRQTLHELQQSLRNDGQQEHQLKLEIQRQEQQLQHVQERSKAIAEEQATLQDKIETAVQHKQDLLTKLQQAEQQLPAHKSEFEQAQKQRELAQTALNRARQELQNAEHVLQEKVFGKKLIINNINQIKLNINSSIEEIQALAQRQKESREQLDAAKMEGLKANLDRALSLKQQREVALAEARNQLVQAESALQDQERNRMQNEQMLHPLRDKLEQSRLLEQEARLHFEQCSTELAALDLNETDLTADLSASAKVPELGQRVASLEAEIEALGAVNLAAIQELNSERERKQHLDNQSQDLNEAIATLEDAIRRIDRETRSRLQQTFEEANRHFAELFTLLFGGGQARLELLGEEILDTGMQVFAQPPGKKNSTIHLLSGGEKALTALALVFALFRLNPAPFCLMDEVDAPLDDSNTERFCNLVKKMSERTQFLFVSHNKITMEMAQQLIGVTMQESGVSRIVEVDIEAAMRMHDQVMA